VAAFYFYSICYLISHSLFLFLHTENQFDYFLMKATTVPCMTSMKTIWNALVMGLRSWYSVRAWDDIICDGMITKEVQANHIERNYHMYRRLLEHHDPHKSHGPGVKHTGDLKYLKWIINQVSPFYKCGSGGDFHKCVGTVPAAHHRT
jgi:hypothetical protein